jgi:hypothetical protein
MDEKKPLDPKDPRVATFLCKNCAHVNQQAFPEVRVITVKEPCKCGVSSDSRMHRAWATALGIAVSILIVSGFGSCAAEHYFTTEQVKSFPKNYTIDKKAPGTVGPDYKVRELTPEEKDRRDLLDTIHRLQKELEAKGAKPSDGK